jgi:glycosyltransferase involved in cell wall biosynthesis
MARKLRIVQAIHTFPPVSQAGSEIYTFNLAKEFSRQHEVTVFYRVADPAWEEYEIQRGVYDGIDVCTVNNTFKNFKSFEDTYRNDLIAKKFGELLDEIKPDIVHFQHVTCLSTTCVHEAKKRGIPIVFTLHDYWLICPRGQFVRRDLTLSEQP